MVCRSIYYCFGYWAVRVIINSDIFPILSVAKEGWTANQDGVFEELKDRLEDKIYRVRFKDSDNIKFRGLVNTPTTQKSGHPFLKNG